MKQSKYYQCVECGTFYAERKINRKGITIEQVPNSLVCQRNKQCQTVGLCFETELSGDTLIEILCCSESQWQDKQKKESQNIENQLNVHKHPQDVKTINQCYQCVECGTYYAEQRISKKGIVIEQVPDSLICQRNESCQIFGLCADVEDLSIDQIIDILRGQPFDKSNNGNIAKELGLCLLLIDASRAMGEHVNPNTPRPSVLKPQQHPNDSNEVEAKGYMSKREMLALGVTQAIWDLSRMRNKAFIVIGITLYDHAQKLVFFKSVEQIFQENRDANTLAQDLLKQMKDMNGGTDINGALNWAGNLVQKFEQGKIEELGNFYPYKQYTPSYFDINTGNLISPRSMTHTTPNVRVMLYAGSEQMAAYGALKSPFEHKLPADPLVCVYLGPPDTRGAKELRSIVHYCPIHGVPQIFIADNIEDFPTLLGIIKSSKGASGFCKKCIGIPTIYNNI
jgi:hypothetical protein